MKTSFRLVGLLFLSAWTCSVAIADAAEKVTFDDHVKPILRQHCLNCHNQGDKRGGLALDSYAGLTEGGGSGELVADDGDFDSSRLWQLVNHDDTPEMPPDQPKLPAAELDVIRSWIEGGILEKEGSVAAKRDQPKNALAFVAASTGRPNGPPPMPETLPQAVSLATERPVAVSAIAASPWAPLVAISGHKQILIYHGESTELLGILPFPEGDVMSLRFSQDGRFLIAGGGKQASLGIAAIYEIANGTRLATVGEELDVVYDADADPGLRRVALGGPKKMLRIFDARDGSTLKEIKKHTDWITAVAFSPDGVLIASGDRAGQVCVWERDTGQLYLDLTDHKGAINAITWRDDSNLFVTASDDGTVKYWDVQSGKAIKSIAAHPPGVLSVRMDHQGQIVTGGKDHLARVWDASGKQIAQTPPMSEMVLEVGITHNSKSIVYGDWSGRVVIADIASISDARELATNPPSPAVRLKALEQSLIAKRSEWVPLESEVAERTAELASAVGEVQAAASEVERLKQSIKSARSEQAANETKIKEMAQSLPEQVAASRDQHDEVIAARLSARRQNDDATHIKIADLESRLADSLLKVAASRREQVKAAQDAARLRGVIQQQDEHLDAAIAKHAEATKRQTLAESAIRDARSARDSVAASIAALQSKREQLTAAIP